MNTIFLTYWDVHFSQRPLIFFINNRTIIGIDLIDEMPHKLKIELSHKTRIQHWDIYTKGLKSGLQDVFIPTFIAVLVTDPQGKEPLSTHQFMNSLGNLYNIQQDFVQQ